MNNAQKKIINAGNLSDMLNSDSLKRERAREECKKVAEVLGALTTAYYDNLNTINVLMRMTSDYSAVFEKMKGILKKTNNSTMLTNQDYDALNRLTTTKLGEFERSLTDQAAKLDGIFSKYGYKSQANTIKRSMNGLRNTMRRADDTMLTSGGNPRKNRNTAAKKCRS
jgi:hypothetical protein